MAVISLPFHPPGSFLAVTPSPGRCSSSASTTSARAWRASCSRERPRRNPSPRRARL